MSLLCTYIYNCSHVPWLDINHDWSCMHIDDTTKLNLYNWFELSERIQRTPATARTQTAIFLVHLKNIEKLELKHFVFFMENRTSESYIWVLSNYAININLSIMVLFPAFLISAVSHEPPVNLHNVCLHFPSEGTWRSATPPTCQPSRCARMPAERWTDAGLHNQNIFLLPFKILIYFIFIPPI